MLYAALTFWLLVIVFAAYGVYQLWAGLIRPKVINAILLPGTLVAQLGYILGLLITGGTVNNARLIKDDETGEPAPPSDSTQIPVIGPILTALLPILACGLATYGVLATIGAQVLQDSAAPQASASLPTSLQAFWDLLHSAVTLVEQVAAAVVHSDFGLWQTWVFLYLIICLTVRMAPLPGLRRGAVGAILLLGLIAAVAGMATQVGAQTVRALWDTLSFAAGNLLLLMMVTLMVRAIIGLLRILADRSVE